jgi:hypothetical protein
MHQRQFTMQDLDRLVEAKGQGSDRVEARPQSRYVPYQPPRSKRDIQRAIYNAVYNAGGAVTRRQIAEAIGIKKTTWLEAHIERLVQDCHLVRTATPYRPGMMMYFYEVQR